MGRRSNKEIAAAKAREEGERAMARHNERMREALEPEQFDTESARTGVAFLAIVKALKSFEQEDQRRVLRAAAALLGVQL